MLSNAVKEERIDGKRLKGTVKWFNNAEGFGFIGEKEPRVFSFITA